MFGIKYESWKLTCNRYFYKLKKGQMKSYLQFYPFCKLSDEDKKYLSSEDFFNTYIRNFSCIMFEDFLIKTNNFLQKGDGSFRNSTLISPILFLIVESIGQEICNTSQLSKLNNIEVFYAGNLNTNDATYKKSYDQFIKNVNLAIDSYNYFIKTDIQNFFDNIDVNILMRNINDNNNYFNSMQLTMIKELLLYCGDDRFPIIENSMSLSYLATVIYLHDIDNQINDFIKNQIEEITDFKIIRYVDDMYIMFNSKKEYNNLIPVYQRILHEYSSILKQKKLSINFKKCKFGCMSDINDELKKSLYDEEVQGQSFSIENLFLIQKIENFLNDIISICQKKYTVTNTEYRELVDKYFNLPDSELSSSEILNTLIYRYNHFFLNQKIIDCLEKISKDYISVIYLNPKIFITMILNTKNGAIIKFLLNTLFNKNRNDDWNIFDTMISVLYLLKRGFVHNDLFNILEQRNSLLHKYCINYCKQSFRNIFKNNNINTIIEIISSDKKLYFLYSMYLFETNRFNMLSAFSYYKNYCDRLIAYLEYHYNNNGKLKKPSFNKFYTEKSWKEVFKNIDNSAYLIKEIFKIRNTNPVCHSSSELLSRDNMNQEILSCINRTNNLFEKYEMLYSEQS